MIGQAKTVRRRAEARDEDLFRKAREPGEAGRRARATLARKNAGLVFSQLRPYLGKGVGLEDLVQEGSVGLLRAMEFFEPEKGAFSTYAVYWIRRQMRRAVATQGKTIRLPNDGRGKLRRIMRARTELAAATGREPSPPEISAHLDDATLAPDAVWAYLLAGQDPASLDAPVPGSKGPGAALGDLTPDERDAGPEAEALEDSLLDELRGALSRLPERHGLVLALRYGLDGGEPQTMAEVARSLGVSAQRVDQLQRAAEGRLRARFAPPRATRAAGRA